MQAGATPNETMSASESRSAPIGENTFKARAAKPSSKSKKAARKISHPPHWSCSTPYAQAQVASGFPVSGAWYRNGCALRIHTIARHPQNKLARVRILG